MLKKLSFALLVFIAVLLSGLSVREYDQYQKEQDAATVTPTPEPAPQPETTPLQTEQLKVENDMLQNDCLVGLEAYNKLSEDEKAVTSAPSCGLKVAP